MIMKINIFLYSFIFLKIHVIFRLKFLKFDTFYISKFKYFSTSLLFIKLKTNFNYEIPELFLHFFENKIIRFLKLLFWIFQKFYDF